MPDFNIITTRGGDAGKSSLLGSERRFKSDPVFAVLGDIDELSSSLGLCRSAFGQYNSKLGAAALQTALYGVQEELGSICALIATPVSAMNNVRPLNMGEQEWIVYLNARLTLLEDVEFRYINHIQLNKFIIPGDNEVSARLDYARTVCRRAERSIVGYIQKLPVEYYRLAQNYLNRLSDFLFVIARYVEQNEQWDSAPPQ